MIHMERGAESIAARGTRASRGYYYHLIGNGNGNAGAMGSRLAVARAQAIRCDEKRGVGRRQPGRGWRRCWGGGGGGDEVGEVVTIIRPAVVACRANDFCGPC